MSPLHKILLPFLLFLPFLTYAQAPLSAHTGPDTVICDNSQDTVRLGATPPAMGGEGSYLYSWDIFPKPYIPFSNFQVWASDLLSDTTAPHPVLSANELPPNEEGPLFFILTVTDSAGNTAQDTVAYYYSSWAFVPANTVVGTFPGDTQLIAPPPISGGFPPYTVDYGQVDSLIGPQLDVNLQDPNNSSRRVVIPTFPRPPQTKSYVIQIIDSAGCSITVNSFQHFRIGNTSIGQELLLNQKLGIYPNPARDLIFVSWEHTKQGRWTLRDISGRQLLKGVFPPYAGNKHKLDLSGIAAGAYLLQVEAKDGRAAKQVHLWR